MYLQLNFNKKLKLICTFAKSELWKSFGKVNYSIHYLQNEVLTDLITRLSIELKLPQSERNTYALKFEDRGNDGVFLTKENRGLVPQGFILILTASPVLLIHIF